MTAKESLLGLKLKEQKMTIEGIELLIKELNAGDSSRYQTSLYKTINGTIQMNLENASEKLISATAYNIDGTKLFEVTELEQIKQLPSHVVEKLFKVASKLNGLDKKVKN